MTGGSILNADMATIMGWLRTGAQWWVGELASLLPRSFVARGRPRRTVATLGGDGALMLRRPDGAVTRADEDAVRQADLAVDPQHCLEREISLPTMNAADLRSFIELERERLFPLSGTALLCDAQVISPAAQEGQQIVRLGAIRRTLAETMLAKAAEAGITPLAVGVAENGEVLRYDFSRSLRAEGLLPAASSQRQIWWSLVAALVLLNIGLLIWRDQQSVAQLQTIVDAQQPAMRVYHAIAGRNARAEALAERTAQRRLASQPLGDLALATAALPTAAWVQRYAWNGRTLQLAGYAQGDVDLMGALRRTPRFADARATTGDVQADIPIGHPFDITVDLKRTGR